MFEDLFDLIDLAVAENIGLAGAMMGIITPLMAASVVLYAIYLAYKALFDSQNLMVMESLNFIASLALVTTVALSSSFYFGYIVPIVANSGDKIVEALLSPPVGGSGVTLQIMVNKIGLQISALNNSINMSMTDGSSISTGLWTYVMIVMIFIASIPFVAICCAYLALAKIMVSLLLVIGPLFIMCAFFPSTRDFFKAWTAQCVNYILLSVLFSVCFAIFDEILNVTAFSGNLSASSIFGSLIVFVTLSFIATQIPNLASSLSGGAGIGGIIHTLNAVRTSGKNKTPGGNIPTPQRKAPSSISAG